METRAGSDVGACFMAVVSTEECVPRAKGHPGIPALFCCYVATVEPTRELGDTLPAAVGARRREQLPPAVCCVLPSNLGTLRAACRGCGGHWSAQLSSVGAAISPVESGLCLRVPEEPSEGERPRAGSGLEEAFWPALWGSYMV